MFEVQVVFREVNWAPQATEVFNLLLHCPEVQHTNNDSVASVMTLLIQDATLAHILREVFL